MATKPNDPNSPTSPRKTIPAKEHLKPMCRKPAKTAPLSGKRK